MRGNFLFREIVQTWGAEFYGACPTCKIYLSGWFCFQNNFSLPLDRSRILVYSLLYFILYQLETCLTCITEPVTGNTRTYSPGGRCSPSGSLCTAPPGTSIACRCTRRPWEPSPDRRRVGNVPLIPHARPRQWARRARGKEEQLELNWDACCAWC